METTQLTLADWIWAFIFIVSFLILAGFTFIMGMGCLLFAEGWYKLVFVPVAFVLWSVWAGIYMGVKARRNRK